MNFSPAGKASSNRAVSPSDDDDDDEDYGIWTPGQKNKKTAFSKFSCFC